MTCACPGIKQEAAIMCWDARKAAYEKPVHLSSSRPTLHVLLYDLWALLSLRDRDGLYVRSNT